MQFSIWRRVALLACLGAYRQTVQVWAVSSEFMVHFSISLIFQRRDLGKVQQKRDLFLARTNIFDSSSTPKNVKSY